MKVVIVILFFCASALAGKNVGETCDYNNQCSSFMCNTSKMCTNGNIGDACMLGWTNDCRYQYTCIDGKCASRTADGDACTTKENCGAGKRCINGKCANFSGEGGVCESSFDCLSRTTSKLKCVESKCIAIPTKKDGESCADDFECFFHCTNDKICYGGITSSGCTQDYECTGKGGYCCAKTGQCGGPNSCI